MTNQIQIFQNVEFGAIRTIMLYVDYARQGFAQSRTLCIRFSNGRVKTHHYLVWTERGREFIHQLLNPKFAN